jgi:hypothetical protein
MAVGDSVGEKTLADLHQYVMAWMTRLEELLGGPSLQASSTATRSKSAFA